MKKEYKINWDILVWKKGGKYQFLVHEKSELGDEWKEYFTDLSGKRYVLTSDLASKNSLVYYYGEKRVKCILEYPELLEKCKVKKGDIVSVKKLQKMEDVLNKMKENEVVVLHQ